MNLKVYLNPTYYLSNIDGTIHRYINGSSLQGVLARMTACDGLSFTIFTTSLDLRKSLAALGYPVPKSVFGINYKGTSLPM